MKIFNVPVEWGMYGHVQVAANSAEEALELFYAHEDEFELPSDGEYIDGSFMLSENDEEQALVLMGEGEDAPNIKEPTIFK